MNSLTLYQVMLYTADESELGGTRSYSVTDARDMIASKKAERDAKQGAAKPKQGLNVGNGTPLGRAFKGFLKK